MIDSGVRVTHSEFEGRAELGHNSLEGTTDEDNNGHGTHVSGTIAGKTVGVAKKANIVGIKAFDSNAQTGTSDILDAINWAVNDIIEKGRQKKAVINMSLSKFLYRLSDRPRSLGGKALILTESANSGRRLRRHRQRSQQRF